MSGTTYREPPRVLEDEFDLCGKEIDRHYRVEAVIGSGGFSVVYRAAQLGAVEIPVAIKVMRLTAPAADKASLANEIRTEINVHFELPGLTSAVVRALDTGLLKTRNNEWAPYLVLEWLGGASLEDVLSGERSHGTLRALDLGETISLLDSAARALAIAHDRGIVHCDIKPSNLYVAETAGQRIVKLIDFGVAKMFEPSRTVKKTRLTARAQMFTPEYGAAEQFDRTLGGVGPWTDVFSFALLCVELMSRAPALDGDDFRQWAWAATRDDIRPTPRTRGLKDTPEEVEAVFQKALAVNPRDRYPNMGAFWEALKNAATVPIRPVDWPSRPLQSYAQTGGGKTSFSAAVTKKTTRRRARPAVLGLGGVLLVAGGAALAVKLLGGSAGPTSGAAENTSVAVSTTTTAPTPLPPSPKEDPCDVIKLRGPVEVIMKRPIKQEDWIGDDKDFPKDSSYPRGTAQPAPPSAPPVRITAERRVGRWFTTTFPYPSHLPCAAVEVVPPEPPRR